MGCYICVYQVKSDTKALLQTKSVLTLVLNSLSDVEVAMEPKINTGEYI